MRLIGDCSLCYFCFLLCGCIIADFYFCGKRVVGVNVRPSRDAVWSAASSGAGF